MYFHWTKFDLFDIRMYHYQLKLQLYFDTEEHINSDQQLGYACTVKSL